MFNLEAKTSSGLWITNLHWDFGDGTVLDSPFSGQNQVSEIRAHIYANRANYCVTVTASDSGGNTGTASVSLRLDFTLNASPTLQNVIPGGVVTYSVNVDLFCGRQAFVKLTTSFNQNTPVGLTWNLNPDSGSTPFASVLSVETASTTPFGTYAFSIIGTGTGSTHSVTVTLVVAAPSPPPDFTISVSPASISVSAQDQPRTVNVTIQSLHGFNGPVNLTVTGNQVSGVTFSTFSINPVMPSPDGASMSQTKISADCSASSATYTIQITGTSSNLVRQANVNITVAGCTFPIWTVLGIIALLLTIPIIFVLIRRRSSRIAAANLLPRVGYCMTCGKPMSFYEAYRRWYCSNCQKFV
jgi:hypothetical protein